MKDNSILPMFAAFQINQVDLMIALSVNLEICPDYLKDNLFKLTREE